MLMRNGHLVLLFLIFVGSIISSIVKSSRKAAAQGERQARNPRRPPVPEDETADRPIIEIEETSTETGGRGFRMRKASREFRSAPVPLAVPAASMQAPSLPRRSGAAEEMLQIPRADLESDVGSKPVTTIPNLSGPEPGEDEGAYMPAVSLTSGVIPVGAISSFHLRGSFVDEQTADPTVEGGSSEWTMARNWMNQKADIRAAIITNELLQPPLGLRSLFNK